MKAIRTPSGATLRSLTDPLNTTGTSPLPGSSITTEPFSATQRSSLPSQLIEVMSVPVSLGWAGNEMVPPDSEPTYTESPLADTTARSFPSGDTDAMDMAGSVRGWAGGVAVEPS